MATCPRLARPGPREINLQQFPERSALPYRGANQTARKARSSDFADPCWHAPYVLSVKAGPGHEAQYTRVVPELMRKGGRRYEKLARSAQGRHRGSRGIRQDRSVDSLCNRMRDHYDIAAITNDIYTKWDAEYLVRSGALAPNALRRRDRWLSAYGDPRRCLGQSRSRGRHAPTFS